jgi:RimJ/RimL family protein N-acetyltransferase
VHVRQVRRGDQALLHELRLASLAADPQAFGSTYARDAARPPEWWKRWAADSEDGGRQRTFVLVGEGGRGLGLAMARLDESRSAEVVAMWVAPEARGRRAARSLCEACAAWAAKQGARELTLSVVIDNWPARRAYEAAGFEICGKSTWDRAGRSLESS